MMFSTVGRYCVLLQLESEGHMLKRAQVHKRSSGTWMLSQLFDLELKL